MIHSLATLALPVPLAYSDPLTGGALTQRIGNYDVDLKTVPANPLAGDRTTIFVRIGGIRGEDVVDTPITIKVTKNGEEVQSTNTVFVPNGHYTYSFNFTEPGMYGIDILIQDFTANGETQSKSLSSQSQAQGILFTFPINIQSKSFFTFSDLQIGLIITIVAAACVVFVYFSKRKRAKRETSYQPSGTS
jgi:hypothetical protein